ncbi:hypothetical protein RSOLAG1IB_05729 [Rhizoctonia solani AG-1 IB]|uniref:Uncharacterized protein n=1 Tax=Thanatephorus cucumeris (strain AG1-IB / isolate 7/3/14) TaxID=1108050 RepID=A0A0B7F4R0_THACB|nr:hypothetical protein RSOLAG1IB_05729 [Rhizoctonia solani AG-1 IB]
MRKATGDYMFDLTWHHSNFEIALGGCRFTCAPQISILVHVNNEDGFHLGAHQLESTLAAKAKGATDSTIDLTDDLNTFLLALQDDGV